MGLWPYKHTTQLKLKQHSLQMEKRTAEAAELELEFEDFDDVYGDPDEASGFGGGLGGASGDETREEAKERVRASKRAKAALDRELEQELERETSLQFDQEPNPDRQWDYVEYSDDNDDDCGNDGSDDDDDDDCGDQEHWFAFHDDSREWHAWKRGEFTPVDAGDAAENVLDKWCHRFLEFCMVQRENQDPQRIIDVSYMMLLAMQVEMMAISLEHSIDNKEEEVTLLSACFSRTPTLANDFFFKSNVAFETIRTGTGTDGWFDYLTFTGFTIRSLMDAWINLRHHCAAEAQAEGQAEGGGAAGQDADKRMVAPQRVASDMLTKLRTIQDLPQNNNDPKYKTLAQVEQAKRAAPPLKPEKPEKVKKGARMAMPMRARHKQRESVRQLRDECIDWAKRMGKLDKTVQFQVRRGTGMFNPQDWNKTYWTRAMVEKARRIVTILPEPLRIYYPSQFRPLPWLSITKADFNDSYVPTRNRNELDQDQAGGGGGGGGAGEGGDVSNMTPDAITRETDLYRIYSGYLRRFLNNPPKNQVTREKPTEDVLYYRSRLLLVQMQMMILVKAWKQAHELGLPFVHVSSHFFVQNSQNAILFATNCMAPFVLLKCSAWTKEAITSAWAHLKPSGPSQTVKFDLLHVARLLDRCIRYSAHFESILTKAKQPVHDPAYPTHRDIAQIVLTDAKNIVVLAPNRPQYPASMFGAKIRAKKTRRY